MSSRRFLIFLITMLTLGLGGIFFLASFYKSTITQITKLNSNSDVQVDSYLFNSPSCINNCWMGLTVGQSSQENIERFFQMNREYPQVTELSNNVLYQNNYKSIDIILTLTNGILSQINLQGNFNLTLEKFIQILGRPSYISVGASFEGGDGGDIQSTLLVYYLDEGYVVSFPQEEVSWSPGNTEVCVREQSNANRISIYTSSGSIEQLYRKMGISAFEQEANEFNWPPLETQLTFGCREVKLSN